MDAAAPAPRRAAEEDVARVTEIITASFLHDPAWSWAFPDPLRRTEQYRQWWRFFIERALPHRWVWLTAGEEAASVWLPPGAPEMPPEDEELVHPMLVDLVGTAQAGPVMTGLARFDQARPRGEPHFYLSLVGTHPDHRGHGFGMDLLAANLALIDEDRMPAYLDSTNPANLARYQRLGFEAHGAFELPDGPTVTTMWRPAHRPP